jgi:calcineurin-like phosphoesterase family protein
MNNRMFLAADLHIEHASIVKFRTRHDGSPFNNTQEHTAYLKERWNETVKPKDTVLILGDAVFGASNIQILKEFNGVKKLIMGNHDSYPAAKYLEVFNSVHSSMQIASTILTHIPVHPCQFPRYQANVHGHLHDMRIDDPRYFCVSMDQIECKPILLADVFARLGAHGVLK